MQIVENYLSLLQQYNYVLYTELTFHICFFLIFYLFTCFANK